MKTLSQNPALSVENDRVPVLSFLLKIVRMAPNGGTFLLCCSLLTFSVLAFSYPLKGSLVPVTALGSLGLFTLPVHPHLVQIFSRA